MTDHVLYRDKDPDVPSVICDHSGYVVLDLCKNCGAAEIELTAFPDCEAYEQFKKELEDELRGW